MFSSLQKQPTNFSRRVLLRLAAGAAPVLAAMIFSTQAIAAKMSKAAAGYRDAPHGKNRCDNCVYWQPPKSCKVVSGSISPKGWCRLWVKQSR